MNKLKQKELNWFEKVMMKFEPLFINRWFKFNENFPKIGQEVQIRMRFNSRFVKQRIFISESFIWTICEKDKQIWLDLLSNMDYRLVV
jgi:hypothetical protein